jgi:16S rRNA A1518/A1519 N6-dimethyltransferase RsmA/KsgA/DIM1 with predicted DNA glycosylase/AP lyase activity
MKKPKSSVLSLFIMKKYDVDEVVHVPKESFVPSPKVESSVLIFERNNSYNKIDDTKFLELIKN